MKLTDKQERFAQAIADGKTQSDAYRLAYNAEGMKPEVVHNKASLLIAKGEVRVRVAELKAAVESLNLWTREKSVRVLAEIAGNEEVRAAEKVSAIKELNSMHGYNAPTKAVIEHQFPREIKIVVGRS